MDLKIESNKRQPYRSLGREMRDILICTVGTSLFEGNLQRLTAETPAAPKNWSALRTAYDNQDWKRVAQELLKIEPTMRVCGAEINTIEEIRKKKWLSLEQLVFLVSDTQDGRNTGEVLKRYFQQRSDLSLQQVEYSVIAELQDERPRDFKVHGLRNLVRKIGEYVHKFGGHNVAIDATGGYKAQIAVAVLLGQALDIPVYYKHERFLEIIDFPPLPISFDYRVMASHSDLLTDFERGMSFSSKEEIDTLDQKLRVLLTEVPVDGETLYELSAIGQIFLTGFRLRNPRPVKLVPAADKKPPSFRDDHYPKGFKEFVEKIWQKNNWIITANSLPYDKQKSIRGIGFKVQDLGDDNRRLIGTYQDENNFGARFMLHLTDSSDTALTWAADYLNRRYR